MDTPEVETRKQVETPRWILVIGYLAGFLLSCTGFLITVFGIWLIYGALNPGVISVSFNAIFLGLIVSLFGGAVIVMALLFILFLTIS